MQRTILCSLCFAMCLGLTGCEVPKSKAKEYGSNVVYRTTASFEDIVESYGYTVAQGTTNTVLDNVVKCKAGFKDNAQITMLVFSTSDDASVGFDTICQSIKSQVSSDKRTMSKTDTVFKAENSGALTEVILKDNAIFWGVSSSDDAEVKQLKNIMNRLGED